jgi:acyl carrier protein
MSAPTTVAPERVTEIVAEVIGASPADVAAVASLFDLPGFDSLAIVAVLEALEDDAGVEVPPERILPEAFATVASLCDLIAGAPAAGTPTDGGVR